MEFRLSDIGWLVLLSLALALILALFGWLFLDDWRRKFRFDRYRRESRDDMQRRKPRE